MIRFSIVGVWHMMTDLARLFLAYALITTVVSFAGVVRIIWRVLSNSAVGTAELGSGSSMWEHYSHKLNSVSRRAVLTFLVCLFVSALELWYGLESIAVCMGDCAGGLS